MSGFRAPDSTCENAEGMTCLRCRTPLDGLWSEDLHYCPGCVADVPPPAPFGTRMSDGRMKRAGRWSVFPHEWFYRYDPRYNLCLRTFWRNFPLVEDAPTAYPAWW